jgi:hypothetical protein
VTDPLVLTRISEVAELAEAFDREKWIFRGVSDHRHQLLPKIGRPGARKAASGGGALPYDSAMEHALLSRFEREARPFYQSHRTKAHISYDWNLQAFAQHHGLATRLLDWSGSPLIAAFFAVEPAGAGGTSVDAAIYAVPCPYEITPDVDKWPAGHEVVALRPPHLTSRITVQRGLFTVHQNPDQPWSPPDLVKWIIPASACFLIKLSLNRIGINHASLFPDVDGVAAHLNWCHKWGID